MPRLKTILAPELRLKTEVAVSSCPRVARIISPALMTAKKISHAFTARSKAPARTLGFELFLFLLVVIFLFPLASLLRVALHNDSCTHIPLVPIISALLIYLGRKRIFRDLKYSYVLGTVILFAGAGFYCLAVTQSQSDALSGIIFSFVLLIIGGFIFWFGADSFRKAMFPCLFLLLMVPLPSFILDKIVYLLQKESTAIAYQLFRLFLVPVLREQFVLVLPGVAIEVAKECSSIRSSVALFITALLAAHLYLRRPWTKFVLVALAIPLAVFKNGVRIFTLCMLAIHVDPGFLTGRLHRDGGIVFYCFALIVLGAALSVLRSAEKPSSTALHDLWRQPTN